jgi:predicted TIM-barrel fold metal-dependent hydrolase
MRDGLNVIDADGHVMEPPDLWERYIDREFYGVRPLCDPTATDNGVVVAGKAMSRTGFVERGSDYDIETFRKAAVGDWFARYETQYEAGWTPECYIEAMDSEGIDAMVLYPSKGLFAASVDDLDGRLVSAIVRAYDRWLSDFCAYAPERLVGVALVGLQEPKLAAEDARYGVQELGHRGVMIRPNPYMHRNLDDRVYDDFYATVAELGVPLATHEGSGVWMPEYGDRFESRLAQHAMCHPMEQMGAVYSFTAGGVFARHPELKVAILEAGAGWLPYWLYRLDEHAEWLEDVPQETGDLELPPSEYFRRQGWINAEADEPGLGAVVDFLGADRLLWASDFPHPDGKYPGAVDALMSAALDAGSLELYAGQNARTLYGLGS